MIINHYKKIKNILLVFVLSIHTTLGLDIFENQYLLKDCNGGDMKACLKFANIYYHGAHNGIYDWNDCRVAVKPYKMACDSGKAEACYNLGQMYLFGGGVTIYPPKGYILLQKACDLEYASGCSDLGFFYREEIGLTKDYKKALKFYEKACILSKSSDFPHGCDSRDELLKLIKNMKL